MLDDFSRVAQPQRVYRNHFLACPRLLPRGPAPHLGTGRQLMVSLGTAGEASQEQTWQVGTVSSLVWAKCDHQSLLDKWAGIAASPKASPSLRGAPWTPGPAGSGRVGQVNSAAPGVTNALIKKMDGPGPPPRPPLPGRGQVHSRLRTSSPRAWQAEGAGVGAGAPCRGAAVPVGAAPRTRGSGRFHRGQNGLLGQGDMSRATRESAFLGSI